MSPTGAYRPRAISETRPQPRCCTLLTEGRVIRGDGSHCEPGYVQQADVVLALRSQCPDESSSEAKGTGCFVAVPKLQARPTNTTRLRGLMFSKFVSKGVI